VKLTDGDTAMVLRGHTQSVTMIANRSQQSILSASLDASIVVWDVASGQTKHRIADNPHPILRLGIGIRPAYNKKGLFYFGDSTGNIHAWDISLDYEVETLERHPIPLDSEEFGDEPEIESFHPSGVKYLKPHYVNGEAYDFLWIGYEDGTAHNISLGIEEPPIVLPTHPKAVTVIYLTNDSDIV
jgi:WD40 repeat protein